MKNNYKIDLCHHTIIKYFCYDILEFSLAGTSHREIMFVRRGVYDATNRLTLWIPSFITTYYPRFD